MQGSIARRPTYERLISLPRASAQDCREVFEHVCRHVGEDVVGVVDRIIPGFDHAAGEPQAFCERVGREIEGALAALRPVPSAQRLATRLARYRPLQDEIIVSRH